MSDHAIQEEGGDSRLNLINAHALMAKSAALIEAKGLDVLSFNVASNAVIFLERAVAWRGNILMRLSLRRLADEVEKGFQAGFGDLPRAKAIGMTRDVLLPFVSRTGIRRRPDQEKAVQTMLETTRDGLAALLAKVDAGHEHLIDDRSDAELEAAADQKWLGQMLDGAESEEEQVAILDHFAG